MKKEKLKQKKMRSPKDSYSAINLHNAFLREVGHCSFTEQSGRVRWAAVLCSWVLALAEKLMLQTYQSGKGFRSSDLQSGAL